MKLISVITTLFTLFSLIAAQYGGRSNEHGKLQIGVTNKIPDEECHRKATRGDDVLVHYTGFLRDDGTIFDSSLKRGDPLQFKLGVGQVIQGWDQGVQGMCIGEKRKLTIPAHLGYGKRGAGSVIPPDADLIFNVELVGIKGYEYENPVKVDSKDEL